MGEARQEDGLQERKHFFNGKYSILEGHSLRTLGSEAGLSGVFLLTADAPPAPCVLILIN